MDRAIWNTLTLSAAFAIAGVGCSSAPKYNEPYAQAAKPTTSSWTDTFTAPFKRSEKTSATAQAANDPTSLGTRNPNPTPELYVASANFHEKTNQPQAAAAEYEKALKLDASYQPALLGYARLLDCQGDFAGATTYYRRAIAARPQDPTPRNDLGICLARQGAFDSSATELSKAVSLRPDKALYRNNLAQVQVEQGRVNDAFMNLQAAHGDAMAHYNLACLLQEKGNIDAARDHAQLALRLDPKLSAAQNLLTQMNAGGTNAGQWSVEAGRASLPSYAMPANAGTMTVPTHSVSYATEFSGRGGWNAPANSDSAGPSGPQWEQPSANSYPSTNRTTDGDASATIRSELVPSRSVQSEYPPLPPLPDQIGS